jgi:hypothetical protein
VGLDYFIVGKVLKQRGNQCGAWLRNVLYALVTGWVLFAESVAILSTFYRFDSSKSTAFRRHCESVCLQVQPYARYLSCALVAGFVLIPQK